jgi:cytochrome c oxidase subunit 2
MGDERCSVKRLAVVLLPLAGLSAGCGGGQSTLHPESGAASTIADLWWAMFAGSVVVFAVVVVLLLVAVLRRRGSPADVPDRSRRSFALVAAGGIAVPAVTLVALFSVTLGTLPSTSPAAGRAALTIDVTGRQWFWDVVYPEHGVRTANELHIPVRVPVEVRVSSADVIHSFWVPRLARKIDMIPGRTNSIVLEASRAGVYRGQCAEFCGLQHAHMAFFVVAEPQARFDAWLRAQARPAVEPGDELETRGLQVLLGSACVYCHRIAGTNATGEVGPDLTHLASRRSIAAGLMPNTPGYLAGWILDPQHLKPGNRMPGTDLSGEELQALLAYLESLR